MREIPEDLRKSAGSGNLVVVVGSGVSIQVTERDPCASWQGLLRDGLAWARRNGLLVGVMALDDAASSTDPDVLLGIAQILRSKLPPESFQRWMEESIGRLSARNPAVLQALESLPAVFVTTNYDDLLARALDVDAVTWRDAKALKVARGEPGVIHLHGHYARADSVILDFGSYKDVEVHKQTTAIWQAFDIVKTILFVGCGKGLSDPHFSYLFQSADQFFEGEGPTHYVLCLDDERKDLRAQLPTTRLATLTYGKRYDELPGFLLRLAQPAIRAGRTSHRPSAGACVGRGNELAGIADALRVDSPPPRIVILGEPGIGKTTLALKALEHFDALPVIFVRCDAASDAEEILRAMAGELGIDRHELGDAVMTRLEEQPAILLLDAIEASWEHRRNEVEKLLSELAALETVRLIVTLRGIVAPARVQWTLRVHPARLDPVEARKMFLAITGERYRRDPKLDPFLAEVDYLPLAIHVIAHRAQSETSLQTLWAQWKSKGTEMLRRPGLLDKDNSVEDSFALSLGSPLMTDAARRLLFLLAFLPNGIQAPVADLLLDGDEAASVLRGLGLLDREAGERVRLFSLLRDYVAAHQEPDAEALRAASAHYVALAVRAEALGDDSTGSVAKTLSAEAANIEKVLPVAIRYCDEADVAAAAVAFARFISYTGIGSDAPVETVLGQVADSRLRARCLKAAADLAVRRSDLHLAKERYELALHLFEDVGDATGAAQCTLRIGMIRAEPHRAVEDLRQTQRLLTDAYDARRLGYAALQQADPASDQDVPVVAVAQHLEDAAQYYRSALKTFREIGSDIGIAGCLRSLADVALSRGELTEARSLYADANKKYEGAGSRLGMATCTKSFGHVAYHAGDYDEAERWYELALPLYRAVAYRLGVANCLHALGKVYRKRRRRQEEQKAMVEAVQLYQSVGARREQMKAVMKLAASYLATNSVDRAVRKYKDLVALADSLNEREVAAEAHEILVTTVKTERARRSHQESARDTWLHLGRPDRAARLSAVLDN